MFAVYGKDLCHDVAQHSGVIEGYSELVRYALFSATPRFIIGYTRRFFCQLCRNFLFSPLFLNCAVCSKFTAVSKNTLEYRSALRHTVYGAARNV